MRASLLLIILFSVNQFQIAIAQDNSEETEVQFAIEMLFDGMRTNDSSKVAAVFMPDAIMQTVLINEEEEAYLNSGSLDRFLKAVGTEKNEIWDEQIQSYEININGRLASAWTPCMFYRGEEFSHCGVNSFQLIKTGEGWKIFQIVDTRRKEGCGN